MLSELALNNTEESYFLSNKFGLMRPLWGTFYYVTV